MSTGELPSLDPLATPQGVKLCTVDPALDAVLASQTGMGKWRIGLWVQSLVYLAGGLNHFVHKSFYLRIMPDHYSHPGTLVSLSGAAEVAGGLGLLLPQTRRVAAGGISLMLVVFFDVHIYMLRHPERFPEVPVWLLWARLPLQFALIAWALHYARQRKSLPLPISGQ